MIMMIRMCYGLRKMIYLALQLRKKGREGEEEPGEEIAGQSNLLAGSLTFSPCRSCEREYLCVLHTHHSDCL